MSSHKENCKKQLNLLQKDIWASKDKSKFDIKKQFIEALNDKRYVAIPNTREDYELLQSSRGVGTEDYEVLLEKVSKREPSEFQKLLLNNINELNKKYDIYRPEKGFVEIGFRFPAVMKYYQSIFSFVRGYDISSINVSVAQDLGWDVHLHDICSDESIDLNNVGLIVAHEVFEHTPNPTNTLQKLYDKSSPGTFLHATTPIEHGEPRIRYAHLTEFHKDDLKKISEWCGWKVLQNKNFNHSDCVLLLK
jgi:hypothetical protein